MQLWQQREAYLSEVKTQGSESENKMMGRNELRDGLAGFSIELSKLSTECSDS